MSQDEIKPSFSLKYFILTIISTVVISGIGLLVSKYFESKPARVMDVIQYDQTNILNDPAFPYDQIEAKFTLKGNPNKKVATLFKKAVIIRNSGNEGAENILISATLLENNAKLVSSPTIKTEPKEIVNAISFTKSENCTDNKQTWNISLLNPGESVILEYFVYSDEKLSSINLNIVPRKKDWNIVNKSLLSQKPKDASETINKLMPIVVGAPILLMTIIFAIALPFYRYQWNRRPDYRERYGTFYSFYSNHRPSKLFDPPLIIRKPDAKPLRTKKNTSQKGKTDTSE